jgi:hypothetical protein
MAKIDDAWVLLIKKYLLRRGLPSDERGIDEMAKRLEEAGADLSSFSSSANMYSFVMYSIAFAYSSPSRRALSTEEAADFYIDYAAHYRESRKTVNQVFDDLGISKGKGGENVSSFMSLYKFQARSYPWDEQQLRQLISARVDQMRAAQEQEKKGLRHINIFLVMPDFDREKGQIYYDEKVFNKLLVPTSFPEGTRFRKGEPVDVDLNGIISIIKNPMILGLLDASAVSVSSVSPFSNEDLASHMMGLDGHLTVEYDPSIQGAYAYVILSYQGRDVKGEQIAKA